MSISCAREQKLAKNMKLLSFFKFFNEKKSKNLIINIYRYIYIFGINIKNFIKSPFEIIDFDWLKFQLMKIGLKLRNFEKTINQFGICRKFYVVHSFWFFLKLFIENFPADCGRPTRKWLTVLRVTLAKCYSSKRFLSKFLELTRGNVDHFLLCK